MSKCLFFTLTIFLTILNGVVLGILDESPVHYKQRNVRGQAQKKDPSPNDRELGGVVHTYNDLYGKGASVARPVVTETVGVYVDPVAIAEPLPVPVPVPPVYYGKGKGKAYGYGAYGYGEYGYGGYGYSGKGKAKSNYYYQPPVAAVEPVVVARPVAVEAVVVAPVQGKGAW